jgi:hypothetical protein
MAVTREEFDKLKSRVDERGQEVFVLWCAVTMLALKASGPYDISWGWIAVPIAIMVWPLVVIGLIAALVFGALESASLPDKTASSTPPIMHPWHQ